jgi:ribosomal protein L11 methyltransferase
MVSLIVECLQSEKDELIAALWERATLGIREEDFPGGAARLHAFFDAQDPALSEAFARFHPQWEQQEDRDWVQAFQDAWEPVEIGESLYLVPEWRDDPAPEGRTRVVIHPGFGYGTGRHQSTRLSLEALENVVQSGDAVLDLGCGAGILASAAMMLGAGNVTACDIDLEAVTAAAKNFAADGVAIPAFVGSARSIRSASFDLLVANINAATISQLAVDLRRITRGSAILAGFTDYDRDILTGRLRTAGFQVRQESQMQEWLCFVVS